MFAKNFQDSSNLDDLGISLTAFRSRTNLKIRNILVTHKLVKKVITNLNLSKASCFDCILVVVNRKYEPELSFILAESLNMSLKESCFPNC